MKTSPPRSEHKLSSVEQQSRSKCVKTDWHDELTNVIVHRLPNVSRGGLSLKLQISVLPPKVLSTMFSTHLTNCLGKIVHRTNCVKYLAQNHQKILTKSKTCVMVKEEMTLSSEISVRLRVTLFAFWAFVWSEVWCECESVLELQVSVLLQFRPLWKVKKGTLNSAVATEANAIFVRHQTAVPEYILDRRFSASVLCSC